MNIIVNDKNGIKLNTAGKYCTEDINITVDTNIFNNIPNGLPIEVVTAEDMDNLLTTYNIGKIYKYVGPTTETYVTNEIYMVGVEE
jgi:hypothetical protein